MLQTVSPPTVAHAEGDDLVEYQHDAVGGALGPEHLEEPAGAGGPRTSKEPAEGNQCFQPLSALSPSVPLSCESGRAKNLDKLFPLMVVHRQVPSTIDSCFRRRSSVASFRHQGKEKGGKEKCGKEKCGEEKGQGPQKSPRNATNVSISNLLSIRPAPSCSSPLSHHSSSSSLPPPFSLFALCRSKTA